MQEPIKGPPYESTYEVSLTINTGDKPEVLTTTVTATGRHEAYRKAAKKLGLKLRIEEGNDE